MCEFLKIMIKLGPIKGEYTKMDLLVIWNCSSDLTKYILLWNKELTNDYLQLKD